MFLVSILVLKSYYWA